MAFEQIQKISGSVGVSFGGQVSIRGYYVITSDDANNIYLYRKQSTGFWEQIDSFTMSGAVSFGSSLDLGNDYMVIGDPGYSSGSGRCGVYLISETTSLLQTLLPSGLTSGDSFGDAVVISDEYILIGAQGADSNRGEVYLYIKDDGETWSEYSQNPITPSLRAANDYFGSSVALSGNTLIVGAEGDNNKTGAIYIFEKNEETEEWEESQKILASDGDYNDQFGESLSADGNYFVVGASLSESTDGEINAGSAYIYKYGTSWYEVDKLRGVGESVYEGNHFGRSVDINGNYIIVGSPGSSDTGVADIFFKQRSWGHLLKITGDDSQVGDYFGNSVAISDRYSIVGSPSEGSFGSIYYYKDPPVQMRLAQEFEVNGEYIPSKASIYLKRVGKNSADYWLITNTSSTVIDSTNFSTIDYGGNITTFDDTLSDFTGNGYMILEDVSQIDYTIINYPIRALSPDTFNLWFRILSTETANFEFDIMLDGFKVKTVSGIITNPSDFMWEWKNTKLILPDTKNHILGIKIKESGLAIDKLYIDASDRIPYSEGPGYGESPYLTIHMRVYDSLNNAPNNSLFIYDYKNSINQIVKSNWYNFNINVLDSNHGYTKSSDFIGNYFLVMSCSGTSFNNFVVWEMMDNDEYSMQPSAFKF
jgi:hypothetical protein